MTKVFLIFLLILNFTAQNLSGQNRIVEDNSEIFPGEDADDKIRKNFFFVLKLLKRNVM